MPNIYKRKSDNYYYVRMPLGKNTCGKYEYETLYAKKKSDLEEKIKEYQKNKGINGERLEKISFSLSQWIRKRLFEAVLPTVTPSTFQGYISLYETHIKDSDIGKMPLKDIKPIHLNSFLNTLKSKGKYTYGEALAASSIKKIKFLLSNSFESAIHNNLIIYNPMTSPDIKTPLNVKKAKERKALTLEQQKAYLLACESQKYGLLYILALSTGLRMGEIIGLKWKYVDFQNKTLQVVETIKYSTVYNSDGSKHKEHVVKAPKSDKSKRFVPLPNFLITRLKELKLQSTSKYVFATSGNTPLNQGNINRGHTAICTRAGMEPIPFHCLRHTYATRLLEAGENFKTLQELLGHADITTTMNIYAHVQEDTKKVLHLN